jgi:hypothetical protein
MAGTSKKAPKKDAKKKAAKRSRYAGKIAPWILTEAKPTVVQVAVESTLSQASEAKIDDFRADMKATREALTKRTDPNRKQLHRRVLVLIYDAVGARVSSTSYDLTKTDRLALNVNAAVISGQVITDDGR